MTIRKRLYISFAFILSVIIFIISIFFYAIYNLNEIHTSQKHRYDQLLRVEKLKEHNNSFSWVVLDIITDYEKIDVVKDRLKKANSLFKSLFLQKKEAIDNSESLKEKENLKLIFTHFKSLENLISNELFILVLSKKNSSALQEFDKKYEKLSFETERFLVEEIKYLQKRLQETENKRDQFIDTIKIELVIVLVIAFLLTSIISTKIISEIKDMLSKLNEGVLQLFNNDEKIIKVDLGEKNELSEMTDNLNSYLEKQDDIIYSREELLRNISHELKTPITKGKFLIEKLKNKNDYGEIKDINSVFIDIEELTSKLLEREKLNFARLNLTKFKVSSLILKSLSKLSIDDESKIILDIKDDFDFQADEYYLTLAIKNLIDNAMKYANAYPIKIETKDNTIFIKNIAPKLSNDLIYYVQPFTRELNQQIGHGLGLNIVNKIVQMHNFKLNYTYNKPYNIFSVSL